MTHLLLTQFKEPDQITLGLEEAAEENNHLIQGHW